MCRAVNQVCVPASISFLAASVALLAIKVRISDRIAEAKAWIHASFVMYPATMDSSSIMGLSGGTEMDIYLLDCKDKVAVDTLIN